MANNKINNQNKLRMKMNLVSLDYMNEELFIYGQ